MCNLMKSEMLQKNSEILVLPFKLPVYLLVNRIFLRTYCTILRHLEDTYRRTMQDTHFMAPLYTKKKDCPKRTTPSCLNRFSLPKLHQNAYAILAVPQRTAHSSRQTKEPPPANLLIIPYERLKP